MQLGENWLFYGLLTLASEMCQRVSQAARGDPETRTNDHTQAVTPEGIPGPTKYRGTAGWTAPSLVVLTVLPSSGRSVYSWASRYPLGLVPFLEAFTGSLLVSFFIKLLLACHNDPRGGSLSRVYGSEPSRRTSQYHRIMPTPAPRRRPHC